MTATYDQMPNRDEGEAKVSQLERIRATVREIKDLAGVPLAELSSRREDTPMPEGYENSPDKEAAIRRLSESLGIGSRSDISPEAVGAPANCTTIVEAGLVWKMQAELEVALGAGNGPIVMGASRFEVPSDAEIEKLSALTGIPAGELAGMTQYDTAYLILTHEQGFGPAAETSGIDAKRASHNVKDLPQDFDGQGDIIFAGTVNGRDVYMYDVPRRQDPAKPGKYQSFKASDVVEHISANDLGGDGICLVTSTTYLPTRALECDVAIRRGVPGVFVACYGQETLARYKSGGEVQQVALNQILGEVAATDKKLG